MTAIDKKFEPPPNLDALTRIAHSFRRIQSQNPEPEIGVQVICHRGKMHAELLTRQAEDASILFQELRFLGLVIQYRKNEPLRTGRVIAEEKSCNANIGAQSNASKKSLDTKPEPSTLESAFRLLRQSRERDYYIQHILQQISDAMTKIDPHDGRTLVSMLGFSNENAILPEEKTVSLERRKVDESKRIFHPITISIFIIASLAAGIITSIMIEFSK